MPHDIHEIVRHLRTAYSDWRQPVVTEMAERGRDPFRVLISTLLSLRTKDEVTRDASERLFALADTSIAKCCHLLALGALQKGAEDIFPDARENRNHIRNRSSLYFYWIHYTRKQP